MRRIISVEEEFERQSFEYLRAVIREINLLNEKDPFFNRIKSLVPSSNVRGGDGHFYFRFNVLHRGRPGQGQLWELNLRDQEIRRTGSDPLSVDFQSDLTPESLLQAFREAIVIEIMSQ